jgi:hypothetical protein
MVKAPQGKRCSWAQARRRRTCIIAVSLGPEKSLTPEPGNPVKKNALGKFLKMDTILRFHHSSKGEIFDGL